MTGFRGASMTHPVEVPDISKIDKMDQLQQQAIDSLEISADGLHVKCQRCGTSVRMGSKWPRAAKPNSDRIVILQGRIKRIEYLRSKHKIGDIEYHSNIREMNEELVILQKEQETRDKLRSLPLYSSRMTGFKYVCSACWDILYKRRARKKL